jgi:hypothetical protein
VHAHLDCLSVLLSLLGLVLIYVQKKLRHLALSKVATAWLALGWVNRSAHDRSEGAGLFWHWVAREQGGLVAALSGLRMLDFL